MLIHWKHRFEISVLGSKTKISVDLSFGPCWPLDKVRYFADAILKVLLFNVEDIFVQCFFLN